jgi:hypothetical protein
MGRGSDGPGNFRARAGGIWSSGCEDGQLRAATGRTSRCGALTLLAAGRKLRANVEPSGI